MHKHYRKRTAPYGFPFLDAQTTQVLNQKIESARNLLVKEGYELVTPASLDYPETFNKTLMPQNLHGHSETFHFRDNLGEELALRSDATVQLIKGFANFLENPEHQNERKFCYSVRVFRDVKKSYPALREVYQVGAEEIGAEEKKAIPNLIRLAAKIFHTALQDDVILLVGDIRVYQFFSDYFEEENLHSLLLEKNIPAFEKILSKKLPSALAQSVARDLLFPPLQIDWQEKISNWQGQFKEHNNFFNGLILAMSPLQQLQNELQNESFELRVEPLLVRKTNYYSGLLFEGYSKHLSQPPLRGGAYDHLVSRYSNSDLPASGFALDISPF